ncbi:MAG: hypothetical protein ABR530_10770 [Pyrinomonadaceae bacterium]
MKRIFGLIFPILLLSGLQSLSFAQDTPLRSTATTWKVQKYDLSVTLPQDNARSIPVKAIVSVKNVSGRPATTLTLRISTAAEVGTVRIGESVADFTKNEEKINAGTSLQRIGLRLPSVAPDASVTATVEYKLNLKDNTALGAVSPASAHFLPLAFWYPTPNSWYFTRGADAAPVRLRVTGSSGHTVVSAGTDTAGTFEQKLLGQPFFIAGSWDTSEQNGVTVYMPKGLGPDGQKRAGELAAIFSEARTFAAGILGKVPDAPLKIVAARRGAGFSSGGTVIVDEAVFRRPKVDSLTAMNLAEAAAKLWLGSGISVSGDGFGAITEGLSRYIATQFIDSKYGKDVADVERLRQRNAYAAVSKRDAPMSAVSPLDDFYYPEVANKGAMVWRIVAKRVGPAELSKTIGANSLDGELTLPELRAALAAQKELLDYLFDQVTDMNLMIGLPQSVGGDTKVSLHNSGAVDVTVDIVGTTTAGERVATTTTIKAKNFGEATLRSSNKITRVEVDAEKIYPQTEYSDDIAPRESTESDPLLAVKRNFDKQAFAAAESTARTLLRDMPRFDDLRALLGRSLLAQNKNVEAEKEFRAILDEKLPTARSIAWANVGLGELSSRAVQNDAALKFAEAAIAADAEYGASLAARNLRNRLGRTSPADAAIKSFFADFDKAASSNRKSEVDALVLPGEVTRFVGGVSGSTEQWQTQVQQTDRIDANTVLVEANMTVKLLNKEAESGIAVYRLVRVGSAWKLAAVEMFEVR